ncbi:hypothetical protein, partial [Streptomyces sp. NRRL S-481]|uniref:hypothetical protein n=1 Tax=Streptomyces sp. NRRL S-481 TaxID=1463911 RepID=UPI001F209498
AEPLPGALSMSAVDVAMTATAAATLFLVPAFIGVSLPFEQAPLSGARMRDSRTDSRADPERWPE